MQKTVVALVGPTCSGKTALSLDLASRLEGEIIACDSRTIYRQMDIGTAKPTLAERRGIPHYMLDVASPPETYTVAQYTKSAAAAIDDITSRGKLPIVCGGTGFYARALLEGLDIPPVPPQPELRVELKELAESKGNEALHEKLAALDPTAAAKINVNDRFRLVRALEVCIKTGQPFSQLGRRSQPPYRTIWLGLTTENRANLHSAIAQRFKQQMKDGMLAEVETLLAQYGPCHALMNTVNYKELVMFRQGEISLSEAEELSVRHNCQLARRQLIWFRSNRDIAWLAVDRLAEGELLTLSLEAIGKTTAI